ncbi:hypothetical protein BB560_003417 [Smittium megazygosporum]|uniref:LYR motif-containing protein Cup1-like N-terminal domain-containing protein n=1 Tax=Smittium megazygosporum TaxID=133381 RepID=A0A2T9ZC75_9FUNG|nr:hypothetical protein BB560_003417 [Smittium megazygosporum]
MDLFTRSFSPTKVFHKSQTITLYRKILKNARCFFDDNSREFIKIRARQRFEKWKDLTEEKKILDKIKIAQGYLNYLERANKGDHKAIIKILRLGYARVGFLKYTILEKQANFKPPFKLYTDLSEFKANLPILYDLFLNQYKSSKALEVSLPLKNKLHKSVIKNRQKAFNLKLLDRLIPPMPILMVKILEARAASGKVNDLYISRPRLASRLHRKKNNSTSNESLKENSSLNSSTSNSYSNSDLNSKHTNTNNINNTTGSIQKITNSPNTTVSESAPQNTFTSPTPLKINYNFGDTPKPDSSYRSTVKPGQRGIINSTTRFPLAQLDFSYEKTNIPLAKQFAEAFNLGFTRIYGETTDSTPLYSCSWFTVDNVSPKVQKWQSTWVKLPSERAIRRAYATVLKDSPFFFYNKAALDRNLAEIKEKGVSELSDKPRLVDSFETPRIKSTLSTNHSTLNVPTYGLEKTQTQGSNNHNQTKPVLDNNINDSFTSKNTLLNKNERKDKYNKFLVGLFSSEEYDSKNGDMSLEDFIPLDLDKSSYRLNIKSDNENFSDTHVSEDLEDFAINSDENELEETPKTEAQGGGNSEIIPSTYESISSESLEKILLSFNTPKEKEYTETDTTKTNSISLEKSIGKGAKKGEGNKNKAILKENSDSDRLFTLKYSIYSEGVPRMRAGKIDIADDYLN